MTVTFQKAIKYGMKGRVAFIGPAGSGKSYSGLVLARLLAGPKGKIAAVDTEHGSLSKYADKFDFDVIDLAVSSVDNFKAALTAAEEAKYDVFMCDSLSHFWMGKGGALEFVDMAAKRHKDQMGGWKDFRPYEREMVDRMLASPCHVIVTMRTKTDYQEQTDSSGKKKRVKIGLAPVQREGLEYEFDLVGYMDDENTLIVDKTRFSDFSQKAFARPGAAEFTPFVEWLKGEERPEPKMEPAAYNQFFSELRAAEDIDTLKNSFGSAYTAAKKSGDKEALAQFTAEYERLKKTFAASTQTSEAA